MTGQWVALVALFATLAAAVVVLLPRDTRRAEAARRRRRWGWFLDLATGEWKQSPLIPTGTCYVYDSRAHARWGSRMPSEDLYAENWQAFCAEERLALTVRRPESLNTIPSTFS